jgi:hypothetical protein
MSTRSGRSVVILISLQVFLSAPPARIACHDNIAVIPATSTDDASCFPPLSHYFPVKSTFRPKNTHSPCPRPPPLPTLPSFLRPLLLCSPLLSSPLSLPLDLHITTSASWFFHFPTFHWLKRLAFFTPSHISVCPPRHHLIDLL